ncbi:MAG: glycoside hydrolase family 127 protein [Bacteroidales bacterium]|nr:glycoside hydrolase family 127 protein [Bacteroidales bacterium]MBQ9597509.1 glycoside hydrolase family 127 protein [Bacteroidales bacterium]
MKRTQIILFILICGVLASCSRDSQPHTLAPFALYEEGLLDEIQPEGWLKEALQRQVSGLSGHPEALSYPFNTCLWNGEIERLENYGRGWWRYEQTAYYSDGLIRLGYALKDSLLSAKVEDGVRYTIAHATPEGLLGSPDILDEPSRYMWPQAVYFRAMQAMYEKTKDASIPEALRKYYLNYTPEQVGDGRNIVNIEGILWTYGKTGDPALLSLARDAYDCGQFELSPSLLAYDGCAHLHGVTYCEQLKIPELLYAWTGDDKYRTIAADFQNRLVRDNMLPDGVPSSAEHLMGNSINNAHETCDISDFTWTEGYFLMTEGEPEYADRIEKAVFNAGFGVITKDFKCLQYFSNVNQFICTGESNPNVYGRGHWGQYRPVHQVECCAGNVHRFLPNFVARMWLKDRDGGLVAALYGPSTLVHGGLTVEERTQYPFDNQVSFVFKTDNPVKIPFSFRKPLWCKAWTVQVNGKPVKTDEDAHRYFRLDRTIKDGDRIDVVFEMPVITVGAAGQGICFQRGPLLYALPIAEKWEEDKTVYPELRGKHSENPDFKAWNITPAGPFNYALDQIVTKVVKKDVPEGSYPYDCPPYTIKLPLRRITWELTNGKCTPPLPRYGAKAQSEVSEILELVPYGCTQLRLTVFPQFPPRSVPIQDF